MLSFELQGVFLGRLPILIKNKWCKIGKMQGMRKCEMSYPHK